MVTEDAAVVEAYMQRYASLPDAELRQIVRGDVPWVEDGRYTYSARRAAHAVLKSRGLHDIPRLPPFDVTSTILPRRIRWGIGIATAATILLMVSAWATINVPSAGSVDDVCAEARQLVRQTDFSYQHRLSLTGCQVDHAASTSTKEVKRTPIRFGACADLKAHHLARLEEVSPRRLAIIRRFASKPAPGRYCLAEPGILAYWVQREGHPWWVEVALLETK